MRGQSWGGHNKTWLVHCLQHVCVLLALFHSTSIRPSSILNVCAVPSILKLVNCEICKKCTYSQLSLQALSQWRMDKIYHTSPVITFLLKIFVCAYLTHPIGVACCLSPVAAVNWLSSWMRIFHGFCIHKVYKSWTVFLATVKTWRCLYSRPWLSFHQGSKQKTNRKYNNVKQFNHCII